MEIRFNPLYFGNYIKTVQKKDIQIKEEFNDDNIKILHEEFDVKNDKFLRQDKWDNKGNPLQQFWFEYFENKRVEHFNSVNAESYTRTITETKIDGKNVRIEEFVSKTNPSKNYIHETIKDLNGKLLSFICDGKKVF